MTVELAAHLTALYEEWFAAIGAEGIGGLDRVLADDWVYTNYDGLVRDKAEYLAWVDSITETASFVGPYDLAVSRHGDLALVLGGYRVDHPGGSDSLVLRFTGLWIERDGRWQCLTHHNTEVTA